MDALSITAAWPTLLENQKSGVLNEVCCPVIILSYYSATVGNSVEEIWKLWRKVLEMLLNLLQCVK